LGEATHVVAVGVLLAAATGGVAAGAELAVHVAGGVFISQAIYFFSFNLLHREKSIKK
jgi:hypothetical protein